MLICAKLKLQSPKYKQSSVENLGISDTHSRNILSHDFTKRHTRLKVLHIYLCAGVLAYINVCRSSRLESFYLKNGIWWTYLFCNVEQCSRSQCWAYRRTDCTRTRLDGASSTFSYYSKPRIVFLRSRIFTLNKLNGTTFYQFVSPQPRNS